MGQWCKFEVTHMVIVRTLHKQGSTDPPVWPSDAEIALKPAEIKRGLEQYHVQFDSADHRLFEFDVKPEEFARYKVGDPWSIKEVVLTPPQIEHPL
jgi:hypothetical protein